MILPPESIPKWSAFRTSSFGLCSVHFNYILMWATCIFENSFIFYFPPVESIRISLFIVVSMDTGSNGLVFRSYATRRQFKILAIRSNVYYRSTAISWYLGTCLVQLLRSGLYETGTRKIKRNTFMLQVHSSCDVSAILLHGLIGPL